MSNTEQAGLPGPPSGFSPVAGLQIRPVVREDKPAQDAHLDIALADWGLLFGAVKAKLGQAVGADHYGARLAPRAPGLVQAQVLSCVAALDQLHLSMVHHIQRGLEVEMALSDALRELEAARAELARVQDSERAARHLAVHDGLTSLPNGAGFRVRLGHVLSEAATKGQAFAVLYIDLDGFKAINDTHGHATGDELLRIVAARLAAAVRAEDMVSRMGGDEFACLLWGAPAGRAAMARLAESLFHAVSAPFRVGELSLSVRPSIGIAMGPRDGLTVEQLIANADAAMYRAKRQQSGHAFFDEDHAD